MPQEAEEKRLPASDKKLREAHKRGQVSQSKDLVSAFTLAVSLAFVFYVWPYAIDLIDELFTTISTPLGSDGAAFWDVTQRSFRQAALVILIITAPLVAIIFVCAVVFGWISTQGPVFSFETISPKFENVNPASGLKKIFGKKNVIEFVKGLAKVAIISAVLCATLAVYLQPLFVTPACGETCIEPALLGLLIPLAIAVSITFIVIGILDVPIQRALFLNEMRMTTTEYKREQKDMEGDPTIRQALTKLRRQSVLAPAKVGVRNAVLVLIAPNKAVALRYIRGETPVPMIVAKGRDEVAREMIFQAKQAKIIVHEDPELATGFYETARVGDFIEEAYYETVVRHLVRFGLT